VAVAIVEVGLGGRLDATNIIDADVAVITSIGLDHMDWLGPTVEHIGREKAGICRAGHPVILGMPPWPVSVREVIATLNCPVRELGVDFEPIPTLVGPARAVNGAAALAAFETLLERRADFVPPHRLDRAASLAALQQAAPRGRFQRVQHEGCEWILDVAHNADSARVLAEALRTLPPARTLGVVGILGDKDATAIGESLAPVIDEWVLCGLEGARGCDAETLRSRLPSQVQSVALVADVAEGCATACALAAPGSRVVVFGSFHVVGPALDWLRI
jgi:dihydrofolate synthase/folylpolyglutamate synthase